MNSRFASATAILFRGGHFYRQMRDPDVWRRLRLAAELYDASVPWIVARILTLHKRGRFLPDECLRYGLADPSVPVAHHHQFFSEARLHRLQTTINGWNVAMCRDKLLFHSYCREFNLPVPKLYGLVSPRGSRSHDGRPLITTSQWQEFAGDTLPRSYIVKPRLGNKGRGVTLVETDVTQDTKPEEAVAALKRSCTGGEDYLIEGRLKVHSSIQQLTGSAAISSLRIFTLVHSDGIPEVMGCYARLIVGDSVTDNISNPSTGGATGNIAAAPDLRTGIIQNAWRINTNGIGYTILQAHPGTNKVINGFELPMWADACRLVQKAALCFLPIRTIGWDVAVTPDGPVLIEANEQYMHSAFGEGVVQLRSGMQQVIDDMQRQSALRTASRIQ